MGLYQESFSKISVIMPAYNAAKTIGESITSVTNQTYHNLELIIVDDASRDSTVAIARAYADKDDRIHVFISETNSGVAATRNTGIEKATGEYLAFLDSDDLWLEDKLTKQLDFMKNVNAAISYTATAYMRDGIRSDYVLRAKKQLTLKDLLRHNIMSCSSVMVRRDVMQHNLFPVRKVRLHEDYAAWLNILCKTGCAYGLDEPLLVYRMTSGSKSSGRITSAIMTYNAYRCVGYSSMISFLFTLRYARYSIFKRYLIRTGDVKR